MATTIINRARKRRTVEEAGIVMKTLYWDEKDAMPSSSIIEDKVNGCRLMMCVEGALRDNDPADACVERG